jgi:hypothetical protein
MTPAWRREHDHGMRKSYGVVWRSDESAPAVGRLGILPLGLVLEGLVDGEGAQTEIRYEDVEAVRVGRGRDERIEGRPTVVIERRTGPRVLVSTVAQQSLVGEIVEGLAALQLGTPATTRTAVIIPTKPESRDAVAGLLAAGPPFDPEGALGLERHEVFLTSHEAVFVFEARSGMETLELLLEDPALWQAAACWRDLVAGPPRLATEVYSWARHAQGLERAES